MLAILVMGCASSSEGESAAPEEEEDGACGEVRTWDVEIRAAVADASGAPIEGITMTLEDRGWTSSDLGVATSDARGEVAFMAAGVTDVEGCWGTVLDYWLVASDPAGAYAEVEETMNSNLYNAIADGELVVDTRERPLVMDAAR